MGLLGCFGGSSAPVPSPQLAKAPIAPRQAPNLSPQAEQQQQQQLQDAIQVLHINGQSASASGAALTFNRNVVPTDQEDHPRIVCHLRSKPPSSSSLHLPAPPCLLETALTPEPGGGCWLYAQPVAANEAAWRALGTQDLQSLTQALVELLNTASLQSLSAVALSVAAPSDMLQPEPYMTSTTSRSAGVSVKVSSSYIRHPEDCTLSPALVLELQGALLAAKPMAAVHQPAAPQPSDPEPVQPAAAPTTVDLPAVRPADNADPSVRAPVHEEATKQLAGRWNDDAAQDELLRARSMLSAIPCIATLLELGPGTSGSDGGSCWEEPGACEPMLGHVLLQNEASLSYWGKLDCEESTGARHLLNALFREEPQDAIQELMRHVAEQQDPMGSGSAAQADGCWSKVVQVSTPRNPSGWNGRSVGVEQGAAGPGDPQRISVEQRSAAEPGTEAVAAGPDGVGHPPVAETPLREGTTWVTRQSHTRASSVSPCVLEPLRQPSLPSPASQPSLPSPGSQPLTLVHGSRIQLCLLGKAAEHRAEVGGSSSIHALETLIPEASCSLSHCSFDLDDLIPDDAAVDHYGHHDATSPRTGDMPRQSSRGPNSLHKLNSPFRRCAHAQPFLPADPPALGSPLLADRAHSTSLRRLGSSSHPHRTSLSFPQSPNPGETVTPSVTNRVMMLSLLTAAGSGPPAPGLSSAADLRPRSQVELRLQAPGSQPLPRSVSGRRIASMSCVDTQPQSFKAKRGPAICSSSSAAARQHSGGPTLLSKMSGPDMPSTSFGQLEDVATKQHLSLPSSVGASPCPSAPQLEVVSLVPSFVLPGHGSEQKEEPCSPKVMDNFVDQAAGENKGETKGEAKVSWELCKGDRQHVSGGSAVLTSSRHSDLIRRMGMEDQQAAMEQEYAEDSAALTHEVQVLIVVDPVSGKPALLILQTDITARALMEKRMSALTETQLTMLENMLPHQVLEYAIRGAGPIGSMAFQHEQVTILFMDIVGFTSMSKEVQPHLVMEYLNRLFSKLDELCEAFGVYKVDTAGDCYIVAGALMTVDEAGFIALDEEADPQQGAKNVVDFAEEIMHLMETISMPHDGRPTSVRIGIHTGSVVSGVVGTKMFKFSLFGDTMNTSSRMESTSKPGCIQVSKATYNILDEEQQSLFKPTGGVEVKGKGLMATYIYIPLESLKHTSNQSLGAINEEGNLEHLWQTIAQSISTSAFSAGVSSAPLMPVDPSADNRMELPLRVKNASAGRSRRFSMESDGPKPVPTTTTTLFNSPQSSRARTRRSYCAAYAEGTPHHMFADMFLAATAAMVQRPQQQQDGARLKLLKSNVKLLKQ